jgi:hypothetical protein
MEWRCLHLVSVTRWRQVVGTSEAIVTLLVDSNTSIEREQRWVGTGEACALVGASSN